MKNKGNIMKPELTDGCCDDVITTMKEAAKFADNIHNDSLLFRIWDKELKVLMYPEFSEIGVTFGPSPDGKHYPKDASDFLFDICAWDGTRYIADKCTGLRDVTGKLIYENDEYEDNEQRHRIIYIEKNASFFDLALSTHAVKTLNNPDININNITICGNFHES